MTDLQHGTRYLIYHEEYGIFLGHCLGLGWWSQIDPVGQDAACTFDSPSDAEEFIQTWKDSVHGCKFIPVIADKDGIYASIDACKTAGLPEWHPHIEIPASIN